MTFLLISLIAGVLTILEPCVLPLLPVVIGSSTSGRDKSTPYVIVISLGISIILFTYLLKVSSIFIMVPEKFWTYISGGIIFFFGVTLIFPGIWESIPGISRFSTKSNKLFGLGHKKKSLWGDIIMGVALGPIFSACSPTYFLILASVLPVSFVLGTVYLLAYTLGLTSVLLLVAILGERFASRLAGFSKPHSSLKRGIGIVFVILGLVIFTGYEKKFEIAILESGFLDITKVEHKLLKYVADWNQNVSSESNETEKEKTQTEEKQAPVTKTKPVGISYKEIVNPAGFVNTDLTSAGQNVPIKIADYVGKKVILLDVMTYSCINCQRTFPYIISWYERYKDDGFIVIGIHTPEFAFEKDKNNVEKALHGFGIRFPVVLDNDYGTWNAYGNRYWPRKYLIDIHGNIVYDHIGEGAYEETETKIRELLKEREEVLGENTQRNNDEELVSSSILTKVIATESPETYFGSLRNEYLDNGTPYSSGSQTLVLPKDIKLNRLYLSGAWNINGEYAESMMGSSIFYRYKAQEVYIVAEAQDLTEIEVWQDGELLTSSRGADVDSQSMLKIKESRLYKIIRNKSAEEHVIELRIQGPRARFYAFTFG